MPEGVGVYNPESDKPADFLGNWAEGSVSASEEAEIEKSSMLNSYKPKDVIQQYGPNKGNIKDVDLAYIAAKAEDDKREELGTDDPEYSDYTNSLSRVAGNQAIYGEIKKRAGEADNLEDWEKAEAGRKVLDEHRDKIRSKVVERYK